MTMSKTIGPYLPLLRRYARALVGNQGAGDSYVAAVLEVLIDDPSVLAMYQDARVGLYRIFSTLFNSLDMNLSPRVPRDTLTAADDRLEAMTPLPRQAFLLCAMEGFTPSETASILDIDESEVERLVARAGKELARQMTTRVLVIEDEPLIILELEGIVKELGHRVVAVARTYGEAIEAARREFPGLVLADIHLADGSSGLDAVNQMLKGFSIPVIFITGYPDRLLTGKRPEPAFLIPKPYQPDTVKAIISQALFFDQRARLQTKLSA